MNFTDICFSIFYLMFLGAIGLYFGGMVATIIGVILFLFLSTALFMGMYALVEIIWE